jgi:hypothetical protein
VLCTLNYQLHEALEHQDSKSHEMQARKRLDQPFIIPRQATKARRPGITALNDPAFGPQNKTFFRLGQLHAPKLHMVGSGILDRLRPCVPLINKSDFDRVTGHLLHLICQDADLVPDFARWPP